MFRSMPSTAVPVLATPTITDVYQNTTAYNIDISVGACDSRYPITYIVYEDGVSIATGTLVNFTAGLQTVGTSTISAPTYKVGKSITVKITSLGVSVTSSAYVSVYSVFSGTFAFTNTTGNAYTDATPTRYWRAEDIALATNPGYYNAILNIKWDWKVTGGGSYTATTNRNVAWPANGNFSHTSDDDSVFLTAAHYLPNTTFLLTVTASTAGYTSSAQVYGPFTSP